MDPLRFCALPAAEAPIPLNDAASGVILEDRNALEELVSRMKLPGIWGE
jgi:hypothetical protein